MYRQYGIYGGLIVQRDFQKEPIPVKHLNTPRRMKLSIPLSRSVRSIKRACAQLRGLILCNLWQSPPPLMITYTYKRNECNIDTAWLDYTKTLHLLRKSFGSAPRYITVPEFQERGAVHFHSLVWGLSRSIDNKNKKYHLLQKKFWKQGYVFTRQCENVSPKLASYLSKYLTKALLDDRLVGKKAYSVSRNVIRPVKIAAKKIAGYENEIFGIPSIESVKEFDTRWLGRCREIKYFRVGENI